MNKALSAPLRTAQGAARWLALSASLVLLGACGHVANTASPGRGVAAPMVLGAASQLTLPGAQEFSLQSKQGKDYRIFIAVPDAKPPAEGFPVLYLLDGNAYFVAAASAMREQSVFTGMSGVQPMIVVGVGYPGEYSLNRERRTFDFLPATDGSNPDQAKMLGAQPGGADVFLSFLVDELRPALAERYRIDPARQSLAGHSLGGYFALHALLHRPDAFRSYAAVSASIWYDKGRLLTEAAARVGSLMAAPTTPAKVDVLLAVSPNELPAYPDLSAIMLSTARSMNTILAPAAARGVQTRYQELPGENHISTNLVAMSAILRQASGTP